MLIKGISVVVGVGLWKFLVLSIAWRINVRTYSPLLIPQLDHDTVATSWHPVAILQTAN